MTDYTPTTDEVRAEYVSQGWAPDGSLYGENDPAEFDRWLADHDRKIAAEALRTEAFSGLYGTFAQERLLTRADRIEQGGQG